MKKYKVLVLTDHRGHSQENSIYALVSTLVAHEQCAAVYVASRGNSQNDSFFENMTSCEVVAKQIDLDFRFSTGVQQFFENVVPINIKDVDVVFLRLPRPISDIFLTYLSSIASRQVFINHPEGIIETSSKAFLLNIPEVCPPIKLCKSAVDVFTFARHFPIVLKPLKQYGGKGVVKIENHKVSDSTQTYNIKDYLAQIKNELETEGYLAMKYLKNVQQGDKRILVVNGQVLASSLRVPAEGSWLCNVAQGGTSVFSEITSEEMEIVKTITPVLLDKGIVFFGLDTLVDDNNGRVLSEINTLSVGGFPQAASQTGKPIIQQAINNMIAYVNSQY